MRRFGGLAGLWVAVAIVAFAWASSAQAAMSGQINGGSFDPSGTTISVSNLTVTNTSCGSSNGGLLYQECGGTAGLMPAALGECPPYGGVPLPSGLIFLWNSAYRATPGDSASGRVSAAVPERAAYRVCLYSKHHNQVQTSSGVVENEETSLVASSVVDAPAPLPTLTEGQALAATKAALAKKFGRRFTRSTGLKVNCVEQTEGVFSCGLKWKYRKLVYRGTAAVSGSPTQPVVELKVAKKRK